MINMNYGDLSFWNDVSALNNKVAGVIDSFKTSKELTTQTWATSLFGRNQPLDAPMLFLDVLQAEKMYKANPAMPYAKTVGWEATQNPTHGYLPVAWKEGLTGITISEATTLGRVPGSLQNDPGFWKSTRWGSSLLKATNAIKLGIEEQAIKTLFYGAYTATSANFPARPYDFGKTELTTEAQLTAAQANHTALNVNLKTLNANGGVGKRCWDTTAGTVTTRNPVQDLKYQYEAYRRANNRDDAIILMSEDTYAAFEAYIQANKDLYSDLFTANITTLEQKNIEDARQYQGLSLRRYLPFTFGGLSISAQLPIYTYRSLYHAIDGTVTNMVPNGYCVILPPAGDSSPLQRRYGRIEHELLRNSMTGGYTVQELAAIPLTAETPNTGMIGTDMLASSYIVSTNMDLISCWKVLNVAD